MTTTEPTDEALRRMFSLLGLAQRSGKLAVGATAVAGLVRRGRRPVVVVARDAGSSQRHKLLALRPVRAFIADAVDREDLAQRFGRRDLVVVGVAEPGFVSGLMDLGLAREP